VKHQHPQIKNLWLKSWRWMLAVTLIGIPVILSFTLAFHNFIRFWYSLKAAGMEFAYYGTFVIGRPIDRPTNVLFYLLKDDHYSNVDIVPFKWNVFVDNLGFYWRLFFSYVNFAQNFNDFFNGMASFARILMVLVLVILMVVILFRQMLVANGLSSGHKSKPLRAWLWAREHIRKPTQKWIGDYYRWFKSNKWRKWIFICLWAWVFNLPAIAIDVVGWYFYFSSSFDFVSFFETVASVFVTLAPVLLRIPFLGYCLIAYLIFTVIRRKAAEKEVEQKVASDYAVTNDETGVFNLILGKMRAGKTTVQSSMLRVVDWIYHNNAYDNMNNCSMMFPLFPWINLERLIKGAGEGGHVHNRSQVEILIELVAGICDVSANGFILGYDTNKYPKDYYDGAVLYDLKDVLVIYAESYWLYFHDDNLIASNYSVRTDAIKKDKGHLIIWDFDSYHHDNRKMQAISRYSHIIDYDMLRSGKKVKDDNPNSDATDGCVIGITEIAKERGNALENADYKKTDDLANPKNDLFDLDVKMGGHLAYIWHTPFFKIISDDQRSGSLSSNMVDVAETIFTVDRRKNVEKTALHLFWFEPLILEWIVKIRDKFYSAYRFQRDDMTLVQHLINMAGSLSYMALTRVYQRYTYKKVVMATNSSDAVGNLNEGEEVTYYLINYIDNAQRFASASYSGFLNANKEKAKSGFFDLPMFESYMATREEFLKEDSYLIMDLIDPSGRFGRNRGQSVPTGVSCTEGNRPGSSPRVDSGGQRP